MLSTVDNLVDINIAYGYQHFNMRNILYMKISYLFMLTKMSVIDMQFSENINHIPFLTIHNLNVNYN